MYFLFWILRVWCCVDENSCWGYFRLRGLFGLFSIIGIILVFVVSWCVVLVLIGVLILLICVVLMLVCSILSGMVISIVIVVFVIWLWLCFSDFCVMEISVLSWRFDRVCVLFSLGDIFLVLGFLIVGLLNCGFCWGVVWVLSVVVRKFVVFGCIVIIYCNSFLGVCEIVRFECWCNFLFWSLIFFGLMVLMIVW